jgi:thiol-disulfide isomerase/thioredoxin
MMLSAYVNMAEAWAGQGMNDKAIALLKRAPVEWPEAPSAAERIEPTLARYMLVGTQATAITAPTWLNMAPGPASVDMKGHVTLLEFTAHWCGPCKESYPGINRLRERFGSKGFRVVLATRLYGYFQAEQNLDAPTEIARDKAYFAEHHLDVPVGISDRVIPVRQRRRRHLHDRARSQRHGLQSRRHSADSPHRQAGPHPPDHGRVRRCE